MKKIVFDVPAESGGALTILNQYYGQALLDESVDWIFVVSTPKLEDKENIKILRYPWIKKSWFHRLYFDKIVAPKLVKKYQPNVILSLQNVVIPVAGIPQILYLHQPLPFVEKRYHIFENFKFWIYQNIISLLIIDSVKKASTTIVQTKWMADAIVKSTGVKKSKVQIEQPALNIKTRGKYNPESRKNNLFFYPSGPYEYKNHILILKACIELKKRGVTNYRVVFSLSGDENSKIKKIYNKAISENLPIDFIGQISIDEVYKYYNKSILVFPSFIETFGLPLLEGKVHGCPILASNCAFSREILEGYEYVQYFDPFNENELASLLLKKIF